MRVRELESLLPILTQRLERDGESCVALLEYTNSFGCKSSRLAGLFLSYTVAIVANLSEYDGIIMMCSFNSSNTKRC